MSHLVAGLYEAAAILRLSDSRVPQLMVSDPRFPQPFDRIKSGPLWWRADLVSYAANRSPRPGRPRKTPDS